MIEVRENIMYLVGKFYGSSYSLFIEISYLETGFMSLFLLKSLCLTTTYTVPHPH
jgi:hypothetical protein